MLGAILSLILPALPAFGAGVEPLMPAAVHRPPAPAAPAPAGLPDVSAVEGTAVAPAAGPEHQLWLYNRGLDESVWVSYGGAVGPLSPAVKRQINHLLRSRDGAEADISPELLDLLARIHRQFNWAPIQIVCGYRSPKYNAQLRRKNRGAARDSYHMEGMAADIRVEGVSTKVLRAYARSLGAGGVGYYRKRRFVHVDVGPVRSW
ncbi:MAG: YcbK family protein [Elusimicrobia bacterium]|nr:YcbK family protein [Elusimicrobiota bacterium]